MTDPGRILPIIHDVLDDESIVALLRLPVGVTELALIVDAINESYGPELVFRTDTGIEGWLFIAREDGA